MPQKRNSTFPSLNKPLTIWGVERRQFFMACVIGVSVFNLFGSAMGGILMWALLFGTARWAAGVDPEFFRIFFRASGLKSLYDPGKPSGRKGVK